MGKYAVIDRDPNQGELEDLKSLINNDLKILIGSNFAEELEDIFNTLDDALEEKEDEYIKKIEELEGKLETAEDIIAGLEDDINDLHE